MAATRLRFFPPPKLAAPTNGNGKHAVSVIEKKGVTLHFGSQGVDFWPVDAAGGTTRDLFPGSSSWYSAAWLAYACMTYRATRLSEPPLWIREEKDGNESWITGTHPLADLLKRPNSDMRMRAFLSRTSLLLDSTGRVVWVKDRDGGERVGALRPFGNDDVVRIEKTADRLFGRFLIRVGGKERWYEAEDVIHLHDEDPADPHGCVSRLDAAAERLGIDRSLVQSIKAGLRNAIRPSDFFEFDPSKMQLTPDQVDQFSADLHAKYAGARNTGKPIATNARVRSAPLGLDGLSGGELSKEVEAAVCAVFQVPPVIIGAYVGLATSQDRHNFESARDVFYENAIEPLWTRIEEALTDDLLAEVDENPLRFVRFVKSGLSRYQTDLTAMAQTVEKLRSELDLDERRAILGYEAATPEQREEIATAPVAPVADPETDAVKRGGGPSGRKDTLDGLTWALFDESTRSQEFGWAMAADAQLQADRDAILAIASRTLRPGRKDDDPFAPADPETVREMIREVARHMDLEAAVQWRAGMEPLTSATARRAVERIAAQVGVSFDLLQPGLLEYVQKEAAWLVTQVTDTTKQAIRDALAAGLLEGEGIPALTKRIQESGAFARSRAELIARTETVRATTGSQLEALRTHAAISGDRFNKRWLTARDSRVRDEHRAMEGETKDLEEAFSNGEMHPSSPNCRCAITMEMAS